MVELLSDGSVQGTGFSATFESTLDPSSGGNTASCACGSLTVSPSPPHAAVSPALCPDMWWTRHPCLLFFVPGPPVESSVVGLGSLTLNSSTYTSNMQCVWSLSPQAGRYLQLTFTEFDVRRRDTSASPCC